MADKKTTNKNASDKKKEKKRLSAKTLGIIGGAVAAVVIVTLIVVLVRSVPKAVKAEVTAAIEKSFGYEVDSLNIEKRYKPENSEFEKETIYLISGNIKSSGDINNNKLKNGYMLVLARVTEQNGEEKIEVRPLSPFKENSKEDYNNTLKALKESPADWQARFEDPILK